jgi:hypothetical protein
LKAGVGAEAGVRTEAMETIETIGFDYKEGFEVGTTLNGLSNIIGCLDPFWKQEQKSEQE